ncbi:MAG: hypothetical protein KDE03_04930 [Rhodobacteraceae bacterium]|nr:hypothetical protein [Paracoccaceae bacterium]
MGRTCREIHEWIEEDIEQPIEEWEERQEERCRNEPCKWWMLCLNKLVCWLVTVLVKVVRWVVVTVGKWVIRVVCTVVNLVLDVIGFIVGLILAIPVIGGIIRTVLNWLVEIVWRTAGFFDFLLSLIGIRPRKKLYFGVVIPVIDGTPLATEAQLQPLVDAVVEVYDRTCNIDARFTGFCETGIRPPGGTITVDCGAGGFFADWWLDGSWFEFAGRICKFESNWRRLSGYGGEVIGFVVNDIQPPSTNGCSMAGTHDYVTIEGPTLRPPALLAHEIGHACLLSHHSDTDNLMNAVTPSVAQPQLTNWQSSVVRWSRHVTYL